MKCPTMTTQAFTWSADKNIPIVAKQKRPAVLTMKL